MCVCLKNKKRAWMTNGETCIHLHSSTLDRHLRFDFGRTLEEEKEREDRKSEEISHMERVWRRIKKRAIGPYKLTDSLTSPRCRLSLSRSSSPPPPALMARPLSRTECAACQNVCHTYSGSGDSFGMVCATHLNLGTLYFSRMAGSVDAPFVWWKALLSASTHRFRSDGWYRV